MHIRTQEFFYLVPKMQMKWYPDLTDGETDRILSHVKDFDGAQSCVKFIFDYTLAN